MGTCTYRGCCRLRADPQRGKDDLHLPRQLLAAAVANADVPCPSAGLQQPRQMQISIASWSWPFGPRTGGKSRDTQVTRSSWACTMRTRAPSRSTMAGSRRSLRVFLFHSPSAMRGEGPPTQVGSPFPARPIWGALQPCATAQHKGAIDVTPSLMKMSKSAHFIARRSYVSFSLSLGILAERSGTSPPAT